MNTQYICIHSCGNQQRSNLGIA